MAAAQLTGAAHLVGGDCSHSPGAAADFGLCHSILEARAVG